MVILLVLSTFAALLLADALVLRAKEKRAREFTGAPHAFPAPAIPLEELSIPHGIFFDRGHTWLEIERSGKARVGMDAFIQKALGRIDRVEMPVEGREVLRGEKLFAIRIGNRTAVFTSPLDGVVAGINEGLFLDPQALTNDPYRRGWICALSPKNLARNLRQLYIAEEAKDWLERELQRLRDFFSSSPIESPALGEVMLDGGCLRKGLLESLDDDSWRRFTQEFLDARCWPNI
jgi:glycine cleavage system H protein